MCCGGSSLLPSLKLGEPQLAWARLFCCKPPYSFTTCALTGGVGKRGASSVVEEVLKCHSPMLACLSPPCRKQRPTGSEAALGSALQQQPLQAGSRPCPLGFLCLVSVRFYWWWLISFSGLRHIGVSEVLFPSSYDTLLGCCGRKCPAFR